MKTIALLALLIIFHTGIVSAQPPAIEWQKSYGGSKRDLAHSICLTADGGYAVAGSTRSSDGDVSGNREDNSSIWILKLDQAGNIEWDKCYNDTLLGGAKCIQQTADKGYIVAANIFPDNKSRAFTIKLDSLGNIEWEVGDDYEIISLSSVSQTRDEGYILAGYGNASGISHLPKRYCVVKLDKNGGRQWKKYFGGTSYDYGNYIEQTKDGGYIVAGFAHSSYGDITGNHGGGADAWILRLDEEGNIIWERALGGTGFDEASVVRQTFEGGYIVAGSSNSNDGDVTTNYGGINERGETSSDYWIVKLNGDGSLEWEKSFGGTGEDKASSIEETADGGYVVIGTSNSTDGDITRPKGGNDFWVIRLNQQGLLEWERSLGGSGNDEAHCIRELSGGSYIVAGGSASANGDVSAPKGMLDCWVVKLNNERESTKIHSLEHDVYIYPNPARHYIIVEKIPAGAVIEIMDARGKIVHFLSQAKRREKIDVQNFAHGIYLCSVKTDRGQFVAKLVLGNL